MTSSSMSIPSEYEGEASELGNAAMNIPRLGQSLFVLRPDSMLRRIADPCPGSAEKPQAG